MHFTLTNEIKQAFASATWRTGEPVAVETYDDEGTTERFQGTHWRDHDFARLEHLTSCLSFFTPAAFCFYLPSYMLAALEQPSSWLAEDLARRLCPPKNDLSRTSFNTWWSRLDSAQHQAIISFLRLMQAQYQVIPEVDIEKLEAYSAA